MPAWSMPRSIRKIVWWQTQIMPMTAKLTP